MINGWIGKSERVEQCAPFKYSGNLDTLNQEKALGFWILRLCKEMEMQSIDSILQIFETAAKERANKIDHFKTIVSALSGEKNFLETAAAMLSDEEFVNLWAFMKKQKDLAEHMKETPVLADAVRDLFESADKKCVEIFLDFPNLFDKALSGKGVLLDANSRHPEYAIADGFIKIHIDERQRTATVSNYEAIVKKMPAEIRTLVDFLVDEKKRLFERPFDGTTVFNMFLDAYLAIVRTASGSDSGPVPIRDIFVFILKSNKEYSKDTLLLDFSRLLQQIPDHKTQYTMHVQQTKDAKSGVLAYHAENRGYIGYLQFHKEA